MSWRRDARHPNLQWYPGDGGRTQPPILIVHGALSFADKFRALGECIVPYFSRVWLLDLPGFGVAEPLPHGGGTLDAAVAFVAGVVRHLRLREGRPLVAVGHSFGALLLTLALQAQHQSSPSVYLPPVRQLVLVSIGSLYPTLHLRWYQAWRTVMWCCFFRYDVVSRLARWLAQHAPRVLAWLVRCYGAWRYLHRCGPGQQLIASCCDVRWQGCSWTRPCAAHVAALRARGVPVALVWGERDALFPCEQACQFARAHDVPLVVVPGAGHQPLMEAIPVEHGAQVLRLALLRAR